MSRKPNELRYDLWRKLPGNERKTTYDYGVQTMQQGNVGSEPAQIVVTLDEEVTK